MHALARVFWPEMTEMTLLTPENGVFPVRKTDYLISTVGSRMVSRARKGCHFGHFVQKRWPERVGFGQIILNLGHFSGFWPKH